jgi:hypothetical protein
MEQSKLNCRGNTYCKLLADTGFECYKAPARISVLRPKIKNNLCKIKMWVKIYSDKITEGNIREN